MIGRLLFRHPLPALLLIWLCIALLEVGGAWDLLNRFMLDFSLRRTARVEDAPADAAIVLIDEQTIQGVAQKYGFRWPWRRDAFAWLAAGLHQAGARQIVFDLAFVEPSEDAYYDDMLGSVTAACPGLLLAKLPAQGEIPERRPVIWPAEFLRVNPELGGRIGHVQPSIDRDGVLRRYAFPDSLAARALPAGVADPSSGKVLRWYGGARELGARGSVLSALEFIQAGKLVLKDVPDAVLLEPKQLAAKWGELPQEDFKGALRGKTVFVGANAAATFDRVATPVGRLEPGVLAHYTAWA
ncbi:MAG TPA: CHASE2 domain-containing protein, partial [Chthoniobacteraceae bacterium]|nr:CHASE2 domain-containing protein [Chthoniobacteraceae bacterium]